MYSRVVIVMFYKKYFGLLKAKTTNDTKYIIIYGLFHQIISNLENRVGSSKTQIGVCKSYHIDNLEQWIPAVSF